MQKVAVVTGGSSGIGRAITCALAQAGYLVLFTYRSFGGAERTFKEVKEDCGNSRAVYCDIADIQNSRQVIDAIVHEFGHIDVLVNNAGVSDTLPIEEIDEAAWDRMLDVNLKGTFFISKYVYEAMKKNGGGRIISITSIAGQRGGRFSGAHYSASKGGVEAMMKCFARQGAVCGITANSVSPGVAETPMTIAEGVKADDVPLGRMARLEEIAAAVCFLASENAAYITGATIDVNGGQLMR